MSRKLRLLLASGLLAFSMFGSAAPASAHGIVQFTNGDLITCQGNGTQVANAYPIVSDTGWVWHRSAIWSYQRGGFILWNEGVYWSHWAYGYGPNNTDVWTDYQTGAQGTAQVFGVPFVDYYDTYIIYNEVYYSDGHGAAYWSNWSNWC